MTAIGSSQDSPLPSVSARPRRRSCVSSYSVTVITPGAGSSITSTTTVSISGPKPLIRCCFFRGAVFTPRFGLALATLGFVLRLRADFDAEPVLTRAAEVLRNCARFFGRDRIFRLAMIPSPQPLRTRLDEECTRWRRLNQMIAVVSS